MAYVTVDTNNRVNGVWTGDISQELEIMNGLWHGKFADNHLTHMIRQQGFSEIEVPVSESVRQNYKIVLVDFKLQTTDYNVEIERAQWTINRANDKLLRKIM
jgi:hypothetical protein